ncbi:MAG TPA: hypothetical protein VMI75_18550 [Polyangiaceae bacterium]|nr:hypothetical protein [Polyangiaceae bacterium]
MGGIFVAGFIFFIIFVIVKAGNAGRALAAGNYDQLAQKGVRGRALVLASTNIAVNLRIGMRRFERRTMTLEVEIPGREPFIAQGTYAVPRGLVEPTPGSSLEVAVDPRGSGQIAVLGPGGFTGPWLNVGPPQPY